MRLEIAQAFHDEMRKLAVAGALSRLWGSHLARTGAGAAVGAGTGALADSDNRVRGAFLGGLAGAGLGAAAPLATRAGRAGAWGATKKWGKHQRYSITGKGTDQRKLALQEAVRKAGDPKALKGAKKELDRYNIAAREGLTSVPGIYRAVKANPLKAVKAGWQSESLPGKAMMVGFTGLEGANVADSSTPEGTAEKAMGMAVGTPAWLLGSRLGFVPGMLGMMGSYAAGGALGKQIDKLRGHKPPVRPQNTQAPPPQPPQAQTPPPPRYRASVR